MLAGAVFLFGGKLFALAQAAIDVPSTERPFEHGLMR
jgi:hypothetical protein